MIGEERLEGGFGLGIHNVIGRLDNACRIDYLLEGSTADKCTITDKLYSTGQDDFLHSCAIFKDTRIDTNHRLAVDFLRDNNDLFCACVAIQDDA